jgi:futalosine hydrolase
MIALLSSMPFESDFILSRLKNTRSDVVAGKIVIKGNLQGCNTVLMYTGIGKVNAAHSATYLIEKYPIKKIINLGVGGAYPGSGLNIGDIAVASKEIYGDEGVFSTHGIKGMKEIGIPLIQNRRKKYFNEFPLNPPPLPFCRGGEKLENGNAFKIKSGSFVTVSATTGTQKRAQELERRFHAICENMEGAAIAQVCTLYKIPMFEIRGISNMVGIRDKRRWNLKSAAEHCQQVVMEVITAPE